MNIFSEMNAFADGVYLWLWNHKFNEILLLIIIIGLTILINIRIMRRVDKHVNKFIAKFKRVKK